MSKPAPAPPWAFQDPGCVLEECETCGLDTPHSVSIEVAQETNIPYRVSVCEECETVERLQTQKL